MVLYIKYFLFLIFILFSEGLYAQKQKTLTGKVSDADTKSGLPYISVSLKNHFLGTTTNENGEFSFSIPDSTINDSLVINSIGYNSQLFAVSLIDKPLTVELKTNSIQLKEVVIRPLAPSDYIRMAMRSIKVNYPDQPFETQSYYHTKTLTNDSIENFEEAVFKTYYPDYTDTIQYHQVMLYRAADKRKLELLNSKGKPVNRKNKSETKEDADTTSIFKISGFGPDQILSIDIMKAKPAFLDSTKFSDYNYQFEISTSYNGNEVIVISFKSDGKVDHQRQEGKIYIDLNSFAFVRVDLNSEVVIPLLLRPILFVKGIGLSDLKFSGTVSYQNVGTKWYPGLFKVLGSGNIEKKFLFKPNIPLKVYFLAILSVSKININTPKIIPVAKRFQKHKPLKDQVFNEDNLQWKDINVITN